MKIEGNSGFSPLNALNKAKNTQGAFQTEQMEKGASFDQISLEHSEKLDSNSRIQQELAAKISYEVRTHNTTGKIAQLKEEVQAGTYTMDASETAARMLLMGEIE